MPLPIEAIYVTAFSAAFAESCRTAISHTSIESANGLLENA